MYSTFKDQFVKENLLVNTAVPLLHVGNGYGAIHTKVNSIQRANIDIFAVHAPNDFVDWIAWISFVGAGNAQNLTSMNTNIFF